MELLQVLEIFGAAAFAVTAGGCAGYMAARDRMAREEAARREARAARRERSLAWR